jgi:hypothetical protein
VAEKYRNPYYKGSNLTPQEKLQTFTTEKTQVNIPSKLSPQVKERKSALKNSGSTVDIDFSAYDEPSMSLQQGSHAKIVRYF